MTIRVVQWATGGVGRPAARAVLAHPELELVGGFAWNAGKAGKDLGELVGLPPLGITATGDIDEILALRSDVVLYMPLIWDVDHMVRLLEAGVNVVSTATFITGRSYGEADMERLLDAAVRGGASLYGNGINPGQASALTAAAACREIKRTLIYESADCTADESAETWLGLGFASPADTPGLAEAAKQRQLVFHDVIEIMADALRVELDCWRWACSGASATPWTGLADRGGSRHRDPRCPRHPRAPRDRLRPRLRQRQRGDGEPCRQRRPRRRRSAARPRDPARPAAHHGGVREGRDTAASAVNPSRSAAMSTGDDIRVGFTGRMSSKTARRHIVASRRRCTGRRSGAHDSHPLTTRGTRWTRTV